jgi:aldose 1-epimerase
VAGRKAPIDHNFCLSETQTTLREVATLSSSLSNITLTISTTEAGLQFYTGHHLSATPDGYNKRPYKPFSGLCLEPQAWPDAPNQKGFPSIFFPANTPYQQISCFEFNIK